MDYLTRYHVQLNCRTKVVEFYILSKAILRLDVKGRLVSLARISMIQTRKLLSKRAQSYLAYLINTLKDKVKIEDVSMAQHYLDAFPEELISLPPEREVKFKIELMSETNPISKTPYRMMPVELKGVKDTIAGFVETMFYTTKYIPMGNGSTVCQKKR